ncbi:iron ABC transporter permease [Leucobacter sp. UCMA 4100]|uniref:iron ABC transporter permease n=1 Tax=Leucobacter sp. UCMA 4100 TaxID=2810534 RepID=UPI0022EA800A|nr:iron ABC transporter permease [Leucobacter sp. UCMA 4100]MDA3148171.1 iron ABC transporter permease [Leucobacter sp. UCMA 4100]
MTTTLTRGAAGRAPERRGLAGGFALLAGLVVIIAAVGLWHLTQGTSGLTAADLFRGLLGEPVHVGGVSVDAVFLGSRLPRLFAGVAVGFSLGVAGALLQSVTRNPLASPDTLAITSGSYFALAAVAAFNVSVPFWASSGVAFFGGVLAAALVLGLTGSAAGSANTRLILAGSAISMALSAGTAMLLILFKESTKGLFAWANGSLAQLNIDASVRAAPLIAVVLTLALLFSRRLDALGLGDDTAASLGVSVRSTRMTAVIYAVLLTSTSVTLAGPIGFVGLGGPVLARLLANRVAALRKHAFLIPTSGFLGALLILLADALLRAALTPEGATTIPTGIPTAFIGGIIIIVLAMRLRDAGSARVASSASSIRTHRRFVTVLVIVTSLLIAAIVVGLLAGNVWLRLGDLALWAQSSAPDLVRRALDERAARVAAALVGGAALALAGTVVQGTTRNPLAEPSLLGISAGAGVGAVFVVTTGFAGGGRLPLVVMAVLAALATFALVTLLSWRGGLLPDRFVLIGIGCGFALTAVTTFMLLSSDPWQTPRILTWLSGTTYGRSFWDALPGAAVLALAVPFFASQHRELDLLSVDDDTPRLLGIRLERTRLWVLTIAAVLAAVSVVAVGVVGFVGLVAPHFARTLVGARHARVIPVAMLLGALLVLVADTLGRTLISPAQLPAGLMVALVGAPYFVWLLRRSRG